MSTTSPTAEPRHLRPIPSDRPFTPIGDVRWRQWVRIHGRIRSIRIRPWADVPSLELVIEDDTGGITIAFLGRRHLGGIELGRHLAVEGTVGVHREQLVIMNPVYDLRG
ncbi:MAG: OB-fold nucleic acid binding domain-containing protein [Actinobacteria bacterium]|nr:OB-fold nucleic acid binding domain-containing protein [Actinomycetota bacterium]